MKRFKEKCFWVLYVAIVLAGTFIIVTLDLQNQYPGIPDVSAQDFVNTYFPYLNDNNVVPNYYAGIGSFSAYGLGNIGSYRGSFSLGLKSTLDTCYVDCSGDSTLDTC